MTLSVRLAGTAALGVLAAVPVAAQRAAPTTWAITGARLVPVSGPPIAAGTLVVRDGRIAALGAGVRAPADARTIDGTGLTIYPGLIDAAGSLGQRAASAGGESSATSIVELEVQVLAAEQHLDELRLLYTEQHLSVVSCLPCGVRPPPPHRLSTACIFIPASRSLSSAMRYGAAKPTG